MPHMATSPFTVNGLADGQEDGARDAERIAECPAREPIGENPDKAWSVRYQQGYRETFSTAQRHRCTKECER